MGFIRKIASAGITPFGMITNALVGKKKDKPKPGPLTLMTEGYSSTSGPSLVSRKGG
jgi:hypothetical protein